MPTEQEILGALKNIIDPDFQKDIVSLGFIKNLSINDGNVAFDIDLTTPACPVKTEFQTQAQEAVRQLPGVRTVKVHMTATPRSQGSATDIQQSGLTSVQSIIAVSSAKGGVGKSTVSGCLALALAKRGFRVGLLDTDIYGPSIPSLFNLRHVTIYVNDKNQFIPLQHHSLKVMSFGFLLGDAPAVLRGPIVSRYIQQLLHNTAWGELDYLFLDMPPGTGDIQLTITQAVRISGAVIVTTRQTLSLVDVSRGILMFEKVDIPILGIIENMSYFICDQCQKRHYIFGGSQSTTLEERFGLPTLAQIPLLKELTTSLDAQIENPLIQEAVDQVVRAHGKTRISRKEIPQIRFDDRFTYLKWSNGEELKVSNRDLRLSCRCALCVDELTGNQKLLPEHVQADIKPKEIFPLGNYAIGINWNDGHTSGIYPYKTIREIPHSKDEGCGTRDAKASRPSS